MGRMSLLLSFLGLHCRHKKKPPRGSIDIVPELAARAGTVGHAQCLGLLIYVQPGKRITMAVSPLENGCR